MLNIDLLGGLINFKNIEIDPSKVLKIVHSLDPNKAHVWDSLSISMIKICDAEIVIPLCLIYENV